MASERDQAPVVSEWHVEESRLWLFDQALRQWQRGEPQSYAEKNLEVALVAFRSAAYERGKADERASVVKFLRDNAAVCPTGRTGETLAYYADQVAAGAHEEKQP